VGIQQLSFELFTSKPVRGIGDNVVFLSGFSRKTSSKCAHVGNLKLESGTVNVRIALCRFVNQSRCISSRAFFQHSSFMPEALIQSAHPSLRREKHCIYSFKTNAGPEAVPNI
jgi:hypothetical protein